MFRFVAGLALGVLSAASACAQTRAEETGQFEFYVLSLSVVAVVLRRGPKQRPRRPRNAGRGLIRSSCTGRGRNTKKDSRNIVCSRRRAHHGIMRSTLIDAGAASDLQ